MSGKLIGEASLTEVINFRVTPQQKQAIERIAKAGGHKSVGHYVRTVILHNIRTAEQIERQQ